MAKKKKKIIQGGFIVMAVGAVVTVSMLTVSVLMAGLGLLGSLFLVDISGTIGGGGWP